MLTKRRVEALRWIAAFHATEGYPPSRAEVGRALGGVTRQQAHRLTAALIEDGLVSVDRNRRIGVTPEGAAFLGTLAANRAAAGVEA